MLASKTVNPTITMLMLGVTFTGKILLLGSDSKYLGTLLDMAGVKAMATSGKTTRRIDFFTPLEVTYLYLSRKNYDNTPKMAL